VVGKNLGYLTALLFLVFTGCSTSLFTGKTGPDVKLVNGDINKACIGLDLSQSTLSVPTMRSFVNCLNAHGSIQPVSDLVKSLSDQQLTTVASVINQEVLGNPGRMQLVDQSFLQMDQQGMIRALFEKLSQILENKDFIQTILNLLKNGAVAQNGAGDMVLDQDVLTSFQLLANELTRENAARLLEVLVTNTKTKSYQSLVSSLNSNIPLLKNSDTVDFLTENFLEYTKRKISQNSVVLGKLILWGARDGTLFQAFDRYFSGSCEKASPAKCDDTQTKLSVEYQIQSLDQFMHFLSVERPDVHKNLVTLFRTMNAPITCMDDTLQIPNGDMFLMNQFSAIAPFEVPAWVARPNMLKMQFASGVCDLPSGFNDMMSGLRQLADNPQQQHGGLVTVVHLINALRTGDLLPPGNGIPGVYDEIKADIGGSLPKNQEQERYRRFLINFLGDADAYTYLTDLMAELANRNITGNGLFFINGVDPDDRQSMEYALDVVMRQRPELRGKSVYDVIVNLVLKTKTADLIKFVKSLKIFVDSPNDYVNSFATIARQSLLMNNINPALDLIRGVLQNANSDTSRAFIQTLLDVADNPNLGPSIDLASRMSKNGNLRELVSGMLMLFRKKGGGMPAIAAVPAPKQVPDVRNHSIDELGPWTPHPAAWVDGPEGLEACNQIDVGYSLNTPFQDLAEWEKQFRLIAKCIQATMNTPFVQDLVDYGLSQKLPNGKPFLPFLWDTASDFIRLPGITDGQKYRRKEIFRALDKAFTDPDTFKYLDQAPQLLQFLLGREYCADEKCNYKFTLFQTFTRALNQVNQSEKLGNLQQLAVFGADLISDPKTPKVINYAYELEQAASKLPNPTMPTKPPLYSYPVSNYPQNSTLFDDLVQKMRDYEAVLPGTPGFDDRIADKTRHYWANVQSGQNWDSYKSIDDFKSAVKPLLTYLSFPGIFEATLGFFFYLDSNPYSPEWWESWLQRLSNNVTAIPYYYPGTNPSHDQPTVRLVNQLDLLELIVIDADYTLKELDQDNWITEMMQNVNDHFAIKYLSKLAQIEPDTNLEREMKKMDSWIDDMSNELGSYTQYLPGQKYGMFSGFLNHEVQRRLYNLNQVVPVLRKFNKVTEVTTFDGKTVRANDLGFLRDLFKAVMSATPKDKWNVYTRNNTLQLITYLSKLGIIRNIGVNMWRSDYDPSTKAAKISSVSMSSIVRLFVEAAVNRNGDVRSLNPDTRNLLQHFLREDCVKKVNGLCDDTQDFDSRFVTLGKAVSQFYDWTRDQKCVVPDPSKDPTKAGAAPNCVSATLREAVYYVATFLGRVEELKPGFVKRAQPALNPIIIDHSQFLADHFELLEPAVHSDALATFLRALMESEKTSPAFGDLVDLLDRSVIRLGKNNQAIARSIMPPIEALYADPEKNFEKTAFILKAILNDPDFKGLNLKDVIGKAKEALSKDTPLRSRILEYSSNHLRDGDLIQLLSFLGAQSKDDLMYKKIRFLGDPTYIRNLQDFITLLRAGIENVN